MSRVDAGTRLTGATPIDITSLSRNTAGNRRLGREVLGVFRDQIGQYLASLEGAADEQAWRLAAHTLKGAARAVGALRVADLAEAAEGAASQPAKWAALLPEIRNAAQDARRFIDYQLLDAAH